MLEQEKAARGMKEWRSRSHEECQLLFLPMPEHYRIFSSLLNRQQVVSQYQPAARERRSDAAFLPLRAI